jgi:hypothetical protein
MALTLGLPDLPCCSHDSHPSGRCCSGQPRSCRDVRAVPRSLVDRASRSAEQQCRRRAGKTRAHGSPRRNGRAKRVTGVGTPAASPTGQGPPRGIVVNVERPCRSM